MHGDYRNSISQVPLSGLLDIAFEALLAEFRRNLEAAGYTDIRPGHGCVFRFVGEEGMRLTELAGLASMTKQSVGEAVDDLARLGYVERIPDPADGRAKLISLTEKGKIAQDTAYELFAALEGRWAERYGKERIAALRELLEELALNEAPHLVPELSRAAATKMVRTP